MSYPLARKARTASMPVLLAMTWLLLPSATQAQDFEGVIEQRTISLDNDALAELMSDFEETDIEDEAKYMRWMAEQILAIPVDELTQSGAAELEEMTLYVKGEKIRTDIQGDEMPFDYMIMDSKSGTMLMVSEAGKFYVEWSAEAMQELMGGMGVDQDMMEKASGKPAGRPEIRALGKTEDVNGVQCEAYMIEHEGRFTVGWISKEHQDLHESFKAYAEKMESMYGEDEKGSSDLLWEKGLPVRIQTLYGGYHGGYYGGFDSYEIEDMVSVERKSISSDLFEVPAGYSEKSMQELWQGGW